MRPYETTQARAAERIRQAGIIAIVRGNFPLARLLAIADALKEGGVEVVELTLNSAGALEGIERLLEHVADEMLVGAGTVRTVEDVDQALGAGARFLVSPNFDPASVARSKRQDVLHLPGVFTPSEAQAAFASGCRMVKLFPSDGVGPGYLKALRAPLDDLDFVPTGGVTADNLAAYMRAGAVAVGLGSALVSGPDQDLRELTERAAAFVAILKEAREIGP